MEHLWTIFRTKYLLFGPRWHDSSLGFKIAPIFPSFYRLHLAAETLIDRNATFVRWTAADFNGEMVRWIVKVSFNCSFRWRQLDRKVHFANLLLISCNSSVDIQIDDSENKAWAAGKQSWGSCQAPRTRDTAFLYVRTTKRFLVNICLVISSRLFPKIQSKTFKMTEIIMAMAKCCKFDWEFLILIDFGYMKSTE